MYFFTIIYRKISEILCYKLIYWVQLVTINGIRKNVNSTVWSKIRFVLYTMIVETQDGVI